MKYLSELIRLFVPSKDSKVKTGTLLVIRDRRMLTRYVSLIFTCAGIFAVVSKLLPPHIFFIVALICIPGIILLLYSDLTVTADGKRKILTLDYRSVLLHRVKAFPFSDVYLIGIQGGHVARSVPPISKYRLTVEAKGIKSIPFRREWSTKEHKTVSVASELNEFIRAVKNRRKKSG